MGRLWPEDSFDTYDDDDELDEFIEEQRDEFRREFIRYETWEDEQCGKLRKIHLGGIRLA